MMYKKEPISMKIYLSMLLILITVIMCIRCENPSSSIPSEIKGSGSSGVIEVPSEIKGSGSSGVIEVPSEIKGSGSSGVIEVPSEIKGSGSSGVIEVPSDAINVPPIDNTPKDDGEPKVRSYTAAGYSPSPYDPLLIKKDITREESGKGIGNRLRVDVEITKKDRKRAEIEDLDIYEIVDDSLQILSSRDDPRAALVNYKKLNSLQDIGELKDNLSRPASYYSQEYESRNAVFIESMKPDVSVIYPGYSRIELNWDNISIDGASDLLNLLKEDFDVEWADRESTNISSIRYEYIDNIKKEVIYINNTKDDDEQIRLQINGSIKGIGNAELTIHRTTYNLTVENRTENGQRKLLIYDWNPNLRLHVRDFSSRDRLFYWYYVKPKKSGSFNAETIVRINDASMAGSPDIIYPQKIDVSEADLRFEVRPILDSSKVYANEWLGKLFGEKLKIEYVTKFIGDASPQYISSIKVEMYNSTDKYHYEGERKHRLDFINKYNSSLITIKYDKPGVYQIPSILIEGQHYDFDETITVDSPWQRNKEDVFSFMAVFGFLLGLIFNKELKNLLKKLLPFKEKAEAEDKDASARDEAAKKMADLIIEALERGAKEKR
jgi:hypothetical protein